MSVYSTLTRLASDWRAARESAHTRRVLGALPNEVLKDIGWPEVDGRSRRNFDSTFFAGR
jgi:uncharacterized protein YjiS (DUF1127 family)